MFRYSHEKWTEIRERGYFRYLIFRGIPIYGFPIIFGSRLTRDIYNSIFQGIPLNWSKFATQLPEILVLGALLGVFFGTFNYSRRERLYFEEERVRKATN
ncbi:MAG: hypothetical protein AAEJ04_01300 [Planctomycetota bacterium]